MNTRTIAIGLAVAALALPSGAAHERTVEGEILTVYPDRANTGVFAVVDSLRPGTIPNGVFYYVIDGVEGGDHCSVEAADPILTTSEIEVPQFEVNGACGFECDPTPGGECIPVDGAAVVVMVIGPPNGRFIYREA